MLQVGRTEFPTSVVARDYSLFQIVPIGLLRSTQDPIKWVTGFFLGIKMAGE
jgi:hypothetical protein